MAIDKNKIAEEALRELTELGTDIRGDLWNEQNKRFLKQMAEDVAGLTAKLLAETDEAKKKRYRRSIDLIANHVAVMAFSRLNVIEQNTKETVLNVLEKAAKLAVQAILARVGL